MNVLTAAVDTESGGFTFTNPGEVVYLASVCDRDRQGGYAWQCGCDRSFVGAESAAGTTLAQVVEVVDVPPSAVGRHWLDDMLATAARFPVGTRLRRRLEAVEPA